MIQGTPPQGGGTNSNTPIPQVSEESATLLPCNVSLAEPLALLDKVEAAEKLYEATEIPIYRFFLHKTRNEPEARDLTGETFKRMLEQLMPKPWYTPPPPQWVWGIAKNVYREWVRRQKRRREGRALEEADEEPMEYESLLDEIARQERGEKLWQAVDRLPEQDKQILYLRHRDGLSYKEVAKVLGKTEDACKVQHHRAIDQLRTILKQTGMWEELGYLQGKARNA